MSALQKSFLKTKLPPVQAIGGMATARAGRRLGPGHHRDYTPIPWNHYFESAEDVAVDGNIFRVYSSGKLGPVLVMLHGGGFSALSWALFSSCVTNLIQCRVLAIDLRGHGDSYTTRDDDLSANTLASDIGNIIKVLYGDEPPQIILIGHSMGGAIAVHTAHAGYIPSLIGLAVIDVVEGTAMDALTSMQSFLRSRPTHFNSIQHAIEWCVRGGQVRNSESARVSMPGQIKSCKTGKLATNHINDSVPQTPTSPTVPESGSSVARNSIPEEGEENDCFKQPQSLNETEKHHYTWRIDLAQTEHHWSGWFQGLSSMFLSCAVPKLLLIAGIDRLDRDLTVGQMQGKFQMQVLPQCGHAVHEDVPDKVAEVLATFMVRHKFTEPTVNFQRTFPAC